MHKTFTGSSRRQRQVNLSGRPTNANPFNARGGPQSMTAKLLDERAERQHQQAMESSARILQKLWRGHICRVEVARLLREEFYAQERKSQSQPSTTLQAPAYIDPDEALSQLRRLLYFADPRSSYDHIVVYRFCLRIESTLRQDSSAIPDTHDSLRALTRLQNKILAAIHHICAGRNSKQPSAYYERYRNATALGRALLVIARQIPAQTVENGEAYYQTAAEALAFLTGIDLESPPELAHIFEYCDKAQLPTTLLELVTLPYTQNSKADADEAYMWLARRFLLRSELTLTFDHSTKSKILPDGLYSPTSDTRAVNLETLLEAISDSVDYPQFASTMQRLLGAEASQIRDLVSPEASFRMLGVFIYIKCRSNLAKRRSKSEGLGDYSADREFILVVSRLLSKIVDDPNTVSSSTAVEDAPENADHSHFLTEQIQLLVDESSLRNLISNAQTSSNEKQPSSASDAILYANYALTMLRHFRLEADQIRMWLFLGPSNHTTGPSREQSAIRYFWSAAKQTETFRHVRDDHRAIQYIILDGNFFDHPHQVPQSAEDDWRVIFMFLELYTFVLKVMNDDEFFSAGSPDAAGLASRISHTRASALPLVEVQDLVTFLKHLGLALYLDVSRLESHSQQSSGSRSIADFFKIPQNAPRTEAYRQQGPAGPTGASLTYMRTLITGLLRMIYERDSRKPFLPTGHWLMNSRLSNIFSTEELFKTLIHIELLDSSEEKPDVNDDDAEMDDAPALPSNSEDVDDQRIIGSGRAQRAVHYETLKLEQSRASGEKQQLFLKPRFGVMENMPYTIP